MKARWTGAVVAAAIVFIAAGYLLSPYWALYQLRSAAADGNGERVAAYVDFPAVRDSLKAEFAARMVRGAESPGTGQALSGIGQTFAKQMLNGVVDAMVSPETVSAMIRWGKAPRALLPDSKRLEATPGTNKDAATPHLRQRYTSVNTFEAALVDPKTNDDTLVTVLTRQGLFGWKLTAVRLPSVGKG